MRRKRKEHWKRRLARQLRRWATKLSPPEPKVSVSVSGAVTNVRVEIPEPSSGDLREEIDETVLTDEAESRVMTSMGGPPDGPE